MSRTLLTRSLILPSAIALCAFAGQAIAQSGTPTFVSGLLHQPLGGGVLGPPVERRVSVINLGSSGQDGVSLRCDTQTGVGCDLDLSQILATPSAACRTVFRDDTGAVRCDLSVTGMDDGSGRLSADFSAGGVTSVRWIARDAAGAVLGQGLVDGARVACQIRCSGGFNTVWTDKTGTEGNTRIVGFGIRSGSFSITGLPNSPDLSGAGSIEFATIICITSPCPGGWGGTSAIDITARGVGQLSVADATQSLHVRPINDPPSVDRAISFYGTDSTIANTFCDMPPPMACALDGKKIYVGNLPFGRSGGVVLDFTTGRSLSSQNIIHRDLAARNILLSCRAPTGGAAGGTAGGELTLTMKGNGKNYVGHVTLIKQRIRPNPATGNPVHYFDATSRGAAECRIDMLNAAGVVIGTVVGGVTLGIEILTCPTPGLMSYTGGCDADGRVTVQCCTPRSAVRSTSGQVFDNVAQIRCTPINPTEPAGLIELCEITGADVSSITVDSVQYDTPIFADGLPHLAKGRASVSMLASGNIRVSNLGSTGQDGVECLLRTRKGGHLSMDATPMLGASTAARAVTASYKGWDGTVKGSMVVRTSAAGLIEHSSQFSPQGISAVRIQARDAFGNVTGDVTYSGSAATWGCAITPDSPVGGPPVSFDFACGKKGLNAVNVSIIHRVQNGHMTLTLPNPATGGVVVCDAAELSVTPVRCAGCNDPWGGTASITLTSSGLSSFDLTGAALQTFDLPVSGAGLAVLTEDCENAATCSDSTVSLRATNIGATDTDGLLIDLGTRAHGAAVSISSSWGYGNAASGGFAGYTRGSLTTSFTSDNVGHPSLIKFVEDEQADGTRTLHLDATGNGSPTCSVTFFDESGRLLGIRPNLPPSTALLLPAVQSARRIKCELYVESVSFTSESGPFPVLVPGTAPIQNVSRFVVVCDTPAGPPGAATACLITGRTVNPIKLGGCILRPPLNLRGIPVITKGKGINELLPDGALQMSNLRPGTGNGASVVVDSLWGGACTMDLTPLLAPGSEASSVTTSRKGWDGVIYGTHRVTGSAAGGSFTTLCDFSSIGAVGVDWLMLDASGAIVDQGTVDEPSISWTTGAVVGIAVGAVIGRSTSFGHQIHLPQFAGTPFGLISEEKLENATATIRIGNNPPRQNVVGVAMRGRLLPTTPWESAVISSIDVECAGLDSLKLTDAALTSFGALSQSVGRSGLREKFQAGDIPGQQVRVLLGGVHQVGGLENTIDDGVLIDFGPGAGSISLELLDSAAICCHITLMKLYEQRGASGSNPLYETGSLRETFGVAGGTATLTPDFSAIGADSCDVALLDAAGTVLQTLRLPRGSSLVQPSWTACLTNRGLNHWGSRVENGRNILTYDRCAAMTIQIAPGAVLTGVYAVEFAPVGQTVTTDGPSKVRFTATASVSDGSADRAAFTITGLTRTERSVACSPADIAGGGPDALSPDGIVDGNDFIRFINAFATGDVAVDSSADIAGGGPNADLPDGIIDGSDFIGFINAFAAGC